MTTAPSLIVNTLQLSLQEMPNSSLFGIIQQNTDRDLILSSRSLVQLGLFPSGFLYLYQYCQHRSRPSQAPIILLVSTIETPANVSCLDY